MYRKQFWARLLFHISGTSLLFGDKVRSARLQGVFGEEILRKAGIIAAALQKKLSGAAAVVFARNLQGRPGAVLQLVVAVNRRIVVDLLVLRVLGADHRTIQKVRGTVDGKAVLAAFAIVDFHPVHLPEVHGITSAKSDNKTGLLQAEAQQVIDVSLHGFLEFRDRSDRKFADAALVVGPAQIAVEESDDHPAGFKTVRGSKEGKQNGITAFVFDAGFVRKVTVVHEVCIACVLTVVVERRTATGAFALAHLGVARTAEPGDQVAEDLPPLGFTLLGQHGIWVLRCGARN